ncbi:TetR/AcrR family transcriptional regulator [Microbacterium esteraromaticum]|uniref:TetR/AcrR family transcriptional regulator n=1 Tax=Microbacterium esteraromaticum TaxID=57043 RepID=A0A939DUJ6_9MICO|nr:TetR/AcrR family transcriptional regulator [Microbacterium esteraromaticum]MBN8205272.1 TetR/AcrR family transcriptional regulator [Microbacterium esteraromaticum]MBN8415426.1 TetR/AcrR family transcriptional regulator [Microbacterium esteraromaticum]MBY6060219.1 TetR/AcrR family transcriptional regulator [Microbacterium esteraromaticum]
MTTPTRSRENTRARLFEAAGQVFAEVGLEGATVEAVCERAGFTRGAFYSNFESKDELFLMLAGTVAAGRLTAVREQVTAMAADGALEDCTAAGLVQRVMDAGGDDRLSIMLMSEIRIRAMRDPAFGAAYLAQEHEVETSIADIIREIVDAGTIALRLDPLLAARVLMIVWEGMAVRGAMSGADDTQMHDVSSEVLGRLVEALLA